jgi:hypothetical protein
LSVFATGYCASSNVRKAGAAEITGTTGIHGPVHNGWLREGGHAAEWLL